MKISFAMDAEWHLSKVFVTCAQSVQITTFVKIVSAMEFMQVTASSRLENQNMLLQSLSANIKTLRWTQRSHLKFVLSRKNSQKSLRTKLQWLWTRLQWLRLRTQDIRPALSRRVSLTSMKSSQVLNSQRLGSSEMMERLHGQLMFSSYRQLVMTSEQSQWVLDMRLKLILFARSQSNAKPLYLKVDSPLISECRQEISNLDTRSGATSWSSSLNSNPSRWYHKQPLSKIHQWRLTSSLVTSLSLTKWCKARLLSLMPLRLQKWSTTRMSQRRQIMPWKRLWHPFMNLDSVTSRSIESSCLSTRMSTLSPRPFATEPSKKVNSRTFTANESTPHYESKPVP